MVLKFFLTFLALYDSKLKNYYIHKGQQIISNRFRSPFKINFPQEYYNSALAIHQNAEAKDASIDLGKSNLVLCD